MFKLLPKHAKLFKVSTSFPQIRCSVSSASQALFSNVGCLYSRVLSYNENDILLSQNRLHKPKTSTFIMSCLSKTAAASSSNFMIISSNIITVLVLIIHILHPCVAVKNHDSSDGLSELIYQTTSAR